MNGGDVVDEEADRQRAVRKQVVERAQRSGGQIDPMAARLRDGHSPPVDQPGDAGDLEHRPADPPRESAAG